MGKKFTKFMSVILAVMMLVSVVPLTANAASKLTEGYYTYTVTDGEAAITKADTSISGDITIPSTLGGYPVTSIKDRAFKNCTSLESITIPDSVTSIEHYAFSGCDALAGITIPDSVTSIGVYAFFGTAYYNNPENWTDGVFYIGNHLIEANPEEVSGDYKVKNGTMVIIRDAFNGCDKIKSITIPASVIVIEEFAFQYADFECIIVDKNNPNYSSDSYGALFNKEKTEIIKYPAGSARTEYTVPESVTTIGADAFRAGNSLNHITIAGPVTTIGMGTFSICRSLESVILPNTVTSIEREAFYECSKLKSITIPDSVTSIGAYAFFFCKSLESLTLGSSLKTIGISAFFGCAGLKDVYFTGTEKQWENIKINEDNDALNGAVMHYNYSEKSFADSDNAKLVENDIFVIQGTTVKNLLSFASKGAVIKDRKGKEVSSDKRPGTGMILVMPDGKEHTIVVLGDVEGDGVITSADARLALRTAVGLENYKENSAEYKAANVESKDKVSAADARLILRAAVGLEDTKSWLK